MKLLLVCEKNHGGGAEAVVNRQAELFRDRGHQVTIFCCHFNPNKQIDGVNYVLAPHHLFLNSLAILKRIPFLKKACDIIEYFSRNAPVPLYNNLLNTHLCQTIERLRPDLVHVHHLTSFRELKATSRYDIPFILSIHNSWPICPSEQLLKGGTEPCLGDCTQDSRPGSSCKTNRCIDRPLSLAMYMNRFNHLYQHQVFQHFACITSPSQTLCNLLNRSPVFKNNPVRHLKNPISHRWLHQPKQVAAAETPYFLAVAQLHPHKGLHLLLEAFAQRPQYRLKIAGNGPEYKALQRTIEQQNLTHVELLGWQEGPALRALYQQSTAVVMPSLWFETMSVVMTESLACAKPVIAFDTGGTSELIHHNKTGLLLPPQDKAALIEALDHIVNSPKDAKTMGLAGYDLLHDLFNADTVYQETMALYETARSSANQHRTTVLRPKNPRETSQGTSKLKVLD